MEGADDGVTVVGGREGGRAVEERGGRGLKGGLTVDGMPWYSGLPLGERAGTGELALSHLQCGTGARSALMFQTVPVFPTCAPVEERERYVTHGPAFRWEMSEEYSDHDVPNSFELGSPIARMASDESYRIDMCGVAQVGSSP